eukprot:TRINITY_DN12738_c0_g1_i1.p1 TRINITY_DN12738_c0_g1~~TRINITY_DN12738_c0_g1_i1.p1  ORF type:complete len:789 (+),score=196.04 TRINITY_DN12738_c0_g1_i1:22-2367(+)
MGSLRSIRTVDTTSIKRTPLLKSTSNDAQQDFPNPLSSTSSMNRPSRKNLSLPPSPLFSLTTSDAASEPLTSPTSPLSPNSLASSSFLTSPTNYHNNTDEPSNSLPTSLFTTPKSQKSFSILIKPSPLSYSNEPSPLSYSNEDTPKIHRSSSSSTNRSTLKRPSSARPITPAMFRDNLGRKMVKRQLRQLRSLQEYLDKQRSRRARAIYKELAASEAAYQDALATIRGQASTKLAALSKVQRAESEGLLKQQKKAYRSAQKQSEAQLDTLKRERRERNKQAQKAYQEELQADLNETLKKFKITVSSQKILSKKQIKFLSEAERKKAQMESEQAALRHQFGLDRAELEDLPEEHEINSSLRALAREHLRTYQKLELDHEIARHACELEGIRSRYVLYRDYCNTILPIRTSRFAELAELSHSHLVEVQHLSESQQTKLLDAESKSERKIYLANRSIQIKRQKRAIKKLLATEAEVPGASKARLKLRRIDLYSQLRKKMDQQDVELRRRLETQRAEDTAYLRQQHVKQLANFDYQALLALISHRVQDLLTIQRSMTIYHSEMFNMEERHHARLREKAAEQRAEDVLHWTTGQAKKEHQLTKRIELEKDLLKSHSEQMRNSAANSREHLQLASERQLLETQLEKELAEIQVEVQESHTRLQRDFENFSLKEREILEQQHAVAMATLESRIAHESRTLIESTTEELRALESAQQITSLAWIEGEGLRKSFNIGGLKDFFFSAISQRKTAIEFELSLPSIEKVPNSPGLSRVLSFSPPMLPFFSAEP